MYRGERFNAWTHLFGAVLAVVGAVTLVVRTAAAGDPWKIVSVSIYGAALILLYTTSTLYHSLKGRAKVVLRKLDHLTIYLLIAGTYTPFCLVTLRGPWGWSLLGVVWGLAIVGMLQEFKPGSEARIGSLIIYAVMGWGVLVASKPMLKHLETAGLMWLAGGGLLYTLGIVFYAYDERFKHWHGIWHLFVMGGSAAHYIAIAGYVV
ncbi:hemolysin III family protein [Propionivibrio sp.]|uniref:PAQR family membrane homeostasis protein TrhA n=2 Tax=Propionivibrio sp. TaxID=2212460 RepID=UPI0025F5F04F|nr:hemolysin III family protein [Propionivibrio sp.]MBK7355252.1 hemolysin III family protein [Propionivibrio sp.]MBK8399647.1 hemolysin III family protein [Propionivibrio sp.]MBK8744940.1 hemolysin III family protein [Propionivibrio sp.]MBK8893540.1 hemolysin III family protein [Propionivibrio sp.]MBL0208627.1 hemolysin III family protein [Propionivibrio sp.]